MQIPDNIKNLIEALQDHEILIADLYKVYAEKFPEYTDFWLKLYDEEVMHAKLIETISNDIEELGGSFREERFNIKAIASSIKYIDKLIVNAEEGDIKFIQALSLSRSIEQGMLENNYFEIFKEDSHETKEVMILLKEDTRKHLKQVMEMISHYQS